MGPLSIRALLAVPALTREREQLLARAARAGDATARHELIQASLRLVAMRVRNLRVPATNVEDALQAGALGLIGAVDRFDPDRGVRLATFAWPWITGAIRSVGSPSTVDIGSAPAEVEFDRSSDVVAAVARLPRRLAGVLELRYRLGESPDVPRTHADVATRLGLSVGQVRRAEAQALGRLRERLATLGDRDPL